MRFCSQQFKNSTSPSRGQEPHTDASTCVIPQHPNGLIFVCISLISCPDLLPHLFHTLKTSLVASFVHQADFFYALKDIWILTPLSGNDLVLRETNVDLREDRCARGQTRRHGNWCFPSTDWHLRFMCQLNCCRVFLFVFVVYSCLSFAFALHCDETFSSSKRYIFIEIEGIENMATISYG